MIKQTLLLLLLLLTLQAAENSWTTETPSLPASKTQTIIEAYEANNTQNITFKDDPKKIYITTSEDNILVLGTSFSFGLTQERVYNTRGEYTTDYSLFSGKVTLGKDFTLWHQDYTQPSRFLVSYSYNYLNSETGYQEVLFGYEERMRYWPLYKTSKATLYPTLSYALGRAQLSRKKYHIQGQTSEITTGLSYERHNFEYLVTLVYHQASWEHPIEGIGDESSSYNLNFGANYRFMYGAR